VNDTAITDRDELIECVRSYLPSPIETETAIGGAVILTAGQPGEVIVKITGKRVRVGLFTIRWDGPHTPVVYPEWLATLYWKNLPRTEMTTLLHLVISRTSKLRRDTYGKCSRCGESKPPEWMHDEETCQSCAERYLGVVH